MSARPYLFRMLLAALSIIAVSSAFGAAPAYADDAGSFYHVQEMTYGCADPVATRLLTNPLESRRLNKEWVKSTFTNGNCVSITPRSPWKFISRDGNVALMAYAGTIGAPGSYYVNVELLFDENRHHPGDLQPPPTANTPTSGVSPAYIEPSATALAPNPNVAPSAIGGVPMNAKGSPSDFLLVMIGLCIAGAIGFFLGRRQTG